MPFCRKLFKKDPTLADAAFGLDIFQKEEGPNTDSVIFPFPTVKDFELATRAQKEAKKKKEEEEKEAKEKEEKEEKEKEKQKKEKEKKEKEKKEKEKQRKKQKEKQKQKEKKKQRRRKHRDTSDSDEDTEEWTDDMVGQALEAAIKTAAEAAADAAQQAHQSALSQTAELSVKMLIEKMKPLFEPSMMSQMSVMYETVVTACVEETRKREAGKIGDKTPDINDAKAVKEFVEAAKKAAMKDRKAAIKAAKRAAMLADARALAAKLRELGEDSDADAILKAIKDEDFDELAHLIKEAKADEDADADDEDKDEDKDADEPECEDADKPDVELTEAEKKKAEKEKIEGEREEAAKREAEAEMKKLERIKLAAEKYEKYLAMLEFQEDDLIIMSHKVLEASSEYPRCCQRFCGMAWSPGEDVLAADIEQHGTEQERFRRYIEAFNDPYSVNKETGKRDMLHVPFVTNDSVIVLKDRVIITNYREAQLKNDITILSYDNFRPLHFGCEYKDGTGIANGNVSFHKWPSRHEKARGTNFCCWCPCGKLDNERISDHLVALATNIGNGEAVAKAIWDAQKKWLSAQGFKVPTAKAFTQFQADVKNGSLKVIGSQRPPITTSGHMLSVKMNMPHVRDNVIFYHDHSGADGDQFLELGMIWDESGKGDIYQVGQENSRFYKYSPSKKYRESEPVRELPTLPGSTDEPGPAAPVHVMER